VPFRGLTSIIHPRYPEPDPNGWLRVPPGGAGRSLGFDSETGEDEAPAWTIRRGATGREAADTIHFDIEHGFVEAEVVR